MRALQRRPTSLESQLLQLCWAVELGHVDITTEVSMLSSHLALPRKGHLVGAFHIFAYLEKKHNAQMVFDPTYPVIDKSVIPTHDWKDFYGNVEEANPYNAPEPLGKEVVIHCFVDADHAGDKLSRRSRTGFIIFVNGARLFGIPKDKSRLRQVLLARSLSLPKLQLRLSEVYAKSYEYWVS
jgi:hypothetical protein